MTRLLQMTMIACAAGAMTLGAQQPGPMPGGPMGPRMGGGAVGDPAQFLLAHTGELKLTDAQVTRLAAIARRSADRRSAMRARMDSMRPAPGQGFTRDSAGRAQMRQQMQQRMEQMRPMMQRMQEQAQADRRDAIAVLTPDQQAQAWERIAASARAGRGMNRAPGRNGFRGGRGFGPGNGGRGASAPGAQGNGFRGRPMPRRLGPPNDGPADRQGPPPRPRPEGDEGR